jgi:hypothetical protein
MSNQLQVLAEKLSNQELSALLVPISSKLTDKAEQTGTVEDRAVAFAVAAAGLRLASL